MTYAASLGFEAMVVGAVLAAALLAASRLVPLRAPATVATVGFVVGVLVHVGFELAGGNAWYCRHGAACA